MLPSRSSREFLSLSSPKNHLPFDPSDHGMVERPRRVYSWLTLHSSLKTKRTEYVNISWTLIHLFIKSPPRTYTDGGWTAITSWVVFYIDTQWQTPLYFFHKRDILTPITSPNDGIKQMRFKIILTFPQEENCWQIPVIIKGSFYLVLGWRQKKGS